MKRLQKEVQIAGKLKGEIKAITTTWAELFIQNYEVAVELLRGEFTKPVVIESVHVTHLLNVTPVFNERDMTGLYRLHDNIEIHHGGLEALELNVGTLLHPPSLANNQKQ